MDITAYLQHFESRLGSYTGDDPLDPWDRFVKYLEQSSPADGGSGMLQVFDTLVQRFLSVEQYANDVRYVNYCIRCASYYPNPAALYAHVFSKGVGTTTAAFYLAWAQQCEQSGRNDQAEAVYQKATENRAQPADAVLREHGQFQARTRSQTPGSAGSQNPLQNSLLTNQMSSHREPAAANKDSVDCPAHPPAYRTVITVSRSETSGTIPSSSGVRTVSAYTTEALVCEGSELCFEEVRAAKYFQKLQEKQALERRETREKMLMAAEEDFLAMNGTLEEVTLDPEACGGLASETSLQRLSLVETDTSVNPDPTQQPFGRPAPSNRPTNSCSLGLRFHNESSFVQEASAGAVSSVVSHHAPHPADRSVHLQLSACTDQASSVQAWMVESRSVQQTGGLVHPQELNDVHQDAFQPAEPEEALNMSQGGTANLSHITPNNSLGFVQATPSRVLPSPTVNTREALDVIMDMFQAPTLLQDPLSNTAPRRAAERGFDPRYPGTGVSSSPAPFTVFQDETDKENGGAAAPSKPIRALAQIPAPNKPNETPAELTPDESAMWGARYNALDSLAACPNSTSDFAMSAQFVSTPFTHKTLFTFYKEGREKDCDGGDAEDKAFRRSTKTLSPIIEQSPPDDSAFGQQLPSSSAAAHGTIVGEGLASAPHCLTSSITMVQPPPPAALSFRDQTLWPTDASVHGAAGWDVYTGPEPDASVGPQREAFTIMEDLDKPASPDRVQRPVADVPMSPECAVQPDWMVFRSPELRVEPDLDAFTSPRQLCADVPMSPVQQPFSAEDQLMMSPDVRALKPLAADVSMNAAAAVPDPWDEELICDLLSALDPPLDSHPRCVTWPFKIPNIRPKTTIRMGKASLRVDCVLGEGAFATVYQATVPETAERTVLKVQKPSNRWEFYIHTRLDARLRPDVRHLFSSVHSAHFFHDGSVLLGELHNHGTLLNAVNIYKTLSDKVMPQPLVMYFAVCILHMVEQLHAVHVVHGDIKPDNFLLGERFLDNKCFEPENLDHGLVLIDFGQSIDMELFPEGTAFTAKCLTSGFQCTEMLSGKPWSYQTDYFGIAGTVYCMLFGTYMQVTNEGGVWKTNGVFRRNPHSDLWQDFFCALLNVPGGGSPPSLRSLRCTLASTLRQNYGNKLSSLKSRMMVLLLESRKTARR
ncbi:hypothetical protein VZT92_011338 [Zoarces viviparus]|uniref:Mitotic checkpoint serine/threonine-protein kinase BUB1 n=1 Tax=Zoarces viviparus TaxID=48416 RepID=A0AAW1FBE8_ZOAVI